MSQISDAIASQQQQDQMYQIVLKYFMKSAS